MEASPEDIAWELVKMVCQRKQQIYSDRVNLLQGIVEAYRMMTGDADAERPASLVPSKT